MIDKLLIHLIHTTIDKSGVTHFVNQFVNLYLVGKQQLLR